MFKPTFNFKIHCPVVFQCCIWPDRVNGMSPTESSDNFSENSDEKTGTGELEFDEHETEL